MTGQRATFDDSTVCSIERTLLDTSFVYIFTFIEREFSERDKFKL